MYHKSQLWAKQQVDLKLAVIYTNRRITSNSVCSRKLTFNNDEFDKWLERDCMRGAITVNMCISGQL
jgi:hypothetical protein